MSLRIHRYTPHPPLARSPRTETKSVAADVGALDFSNLVRQELARQAAPSQAQPAAAPPVSSQPASIVPSPRQLAANAPPKPKPRGVDYSQGTPNELLTDRDRLDQGHGVWYNCGTRLYESQDGSIVGTNPYAVLQYTDPGFYRGPEAIGPILTGDDYYWERQPAALQKLRPSVTPDIEERGRIAAELIEQGHQIDWNIHVLGQSPAATMWQRERFLGQELTDIFGQPVELPFMSIPKDLPFPGVIRKP